MNVDKFIKVFKMAMIGVLMLGIAAGFDGLWGVPYLYSKGLFHDSFFNSIMSHGLFYTLVIPAAGYGLYVEATWGVITTISLCDN